MLFQGRIDRRSFLQCLETHGQMGFREAAGYLRDHIRGCREVAIYRCIGTGEEVTLLGTTAYCLELIRRMEDSARSFLQGTPENLEDGASPQKEYLEGIFLTDGGKTAGILLLLFSGKGWIGKWQVRRGIFARLFQDLAEEITRDCRDAFLLQDKDPKSGLYLPETLQEDLTLPGYTLFVLHCTRADPGKMGKILNGFSGESRGYRIGRQMYALLVPQMSLSDSAVVAQKLEERLQACGISADLATGPASPKGLEQGIAQVLKYGSGISLFGWQEHLEDMKKIGKVKESGTREEEAPDSISEKWLGNSIIKEIPLPAPRKKRVGSRRKAVKQEDPEYTQRSLFDPDGALGKEKTE